MTLDGLATPAGPNFNNRIDGTWGEFVSPAGRVAYLMTNARLGRSGTDTERRLTSKLRPVREVLDVRQMNLDQLLQRDLDDHRVATELIPYLLQPTIGPVFLPPILAVLLPFDASGAATSFQPLEDVPDFRDDDLTFLARTSGNAFRELRLQDQDANLAPIKVGRLYWNEELAKIVVLDGQHRAMALLAIDRTLNNSWEDDARGARYRHFYEERVRHALAEIGTEAIDMVHTPVTLCWFPELVDGTDAPHRAARKLFVDVNRNARPPSEDRVVLLSDDDLLNILTRSVLNHLQAESSSPPLFAIEYDNPAAKGGHPTRWSAIASLQSIKNLVDRTVFGPDKYVHDVRLVLPPGRPNDVQRNHRMRTQLRVQDHVESELEDRRGSMRREEIAQDRFPISAVPALRAAFLEGWGSAIITLLGELAPYRAHTAALRQLKEDWPTTDPGTVSALAYEAIFEGVGMYWTLRSSYEHLRSADPSAAMSQDVTNAWNLVEQKSEEFRQLRAPLLLGSSASIEEADSAISVFRTMACQIGLGLMTATLCYEIQATGPTVADFATSLVEVLNDSLETAGTSSGRLRMLALSAESDQSLNRIVRMNTGRATEFRYLWLEMLCANEAGLSQLERQDGLRRDRVHDIRNQARRRYVSYLADEGTNQRWRLNRTLDKEQLRLEVTVGIHQDLRSALSAWCQVPQDDYDSWRRSLVETSTAAADEDDEEDEDAR